MISPKVALLSVHVQKAHVVLCIHTQACVGLPPPARASYQAQRWWNTCKLTTSLDPISVVLGSVPKPSA